MVKRKHRINLFVDDDELAELQKRADDLGVDIPSAIRMALRQTDRDPDVRQAYIEASSSGPATRLSQIKADEVEESDSA
jgi:hypothetical protein